jgi:hypothetical protein
MKSQTGVDDPLRLEGLSQDVFIETREGAEISTSSAQHAHPTVQAPVSLIGWGFALACGLAMWILIFSLFY